MVNQITLDELLEDEEYKQYFLKVPKLPAHYRGKQPWKLMILKKGETQWRVKRFDLYSDAFKMLKKLRPTLQDAAINCPGLDWQPPVKRFRVKGKYVRINRKETPMIRTQVWKASIPSDLPEHHWCPYCRRPTVFSYFTVHPSMTRQRVGNMGANVDPTKLRCTICGASETIVNLRDSLNHQNWDPSRIVRQEDLLR